MIIEKTEEIGVIKSVIFNPDIWAVISDEGSEQKDFDIPINDNCIYLVGREGEEVIGMLIVHMTSFKLWQGHIQILPEHRKKHAIDFGTKAMAWIWSQTKINKLIAMVPEIYPNVKGYLDLHGFDEEGFITNSYHRGGKAYGNWLMSKNRRT